VGIEALKWRDRSCARALVRVKGWKMVIAQLERMDEEYGFEDSDNDEWNRYDFYVDRTKKGNPYFKNLFYADGSDANVHKNWIKNQFEFSLVKDGGMLLASQDSIRLCGKKSRRAR
jgi:hypothetical protein